MAFFSSQNNWKRPRKLENKNSLSVPFLPNAQQKLPKKLTKKLKKFKKTTRASFQAKTGWKMLEKRENKNYRFVSFLPDG